jgi:ParB/RepB/Spo0J family partition protein
MGNETYTVVDVLMSDIFADTEFNCRGRIIPFDVIDLAKDIQQQGLMSPIVLQPYDKQPGFKYRIIAGHRRHMAHIVNKATTIPAMIRTDLDDSSARIFNLGENLKRKDLTLYEEALAIRKLKQAGMSDSIIVQRLGVHKRWVEIRCMVLELPDAVQYEVRAGMLNQTNVRDLYNIRHDPERQVDLVKRIKNAKYLGQSTNIKPEYKEKKKYSCKKRRNQSDCMKLMDYITKYVGRGLTTRCIAWINGEISDSELVNTIENIVTAKGDLYIRPENDVFV